MVIAETYSIISRKDDLYKVSRKLWPQRIKTSLDLLFLGILVQKVKVLLRRNYKLIFRQIATGKRDR